MYDELMRAVKLYFDQVKVLKRSARGEITLLRHRETGKRYVFRHFFFSFIKPPKAYINARPEALPALLHLNFFYQYARGILPPERNDRSLNIKSSRISRRPALKALHACAGCEAYILKPASHRAVCFKARYPDNLSRLRLSQA